MVPISAVVNASGILHMNEKIKKPRRAKRGPAAPIVSSTPNGSPETSKEYKR